MSKQKTRTHDYTSQRWGHSISYKPTGKDHDISGTMFATQAHAGDYLILPNGESSTRYRITELTWHSDPGDQWFFTAAFAPRAEGEV